MFNAGIAAKYKPFRAKLKKDEDKKL